MPPFVPPWPPGAGSTTASDAHAKNTQQEKRTEITFIEAPFVSDLTTILNNAINVTLNQVSRACCWSAIETLWQRTVAWVVFAEWPGVWTFVGGAVIFASTVYITRREAATRRSVQPTTRLGETRL